MAALLSTVKLNLEKHFPFLAILVFGLPVIRIYEVFYE